MPHVREAFDGQDFRLNVRLRQTIAWRHRPSHRRLFRHRPFSRRFKESSSAPNPGASPVSAAAVQRKGSAVNSPRIPCLQDIICMGDGATKRPSD